MTETGILFFSRVPRDMRPSEIRDIFTRFGPIFRQKFVVVETNTKKAQMLRKKIGKSKSLQFKEGWLEFNNFTDAKDAMDQMNAQPVDVKNTRRAAGDLWACKVLPRGYRWEDLVTEMEGEKRLRRMKIQAELQREKEINEAYRQLAMQEIARRKQQQQGNDDDNNNNNHTISDIKDKPRKTSKTSNNNNVERDDSVLMVSDFVKEANSIPSQLMKIKRKKFQEVKKMKAAKAKQQQEGGSSSSSNDTNGLGAVAGKKQNTTVASVISAKNKIAKVYTSDGYRDLYNS